MRVLGICGSPRAGSNSEVLLNAALSPFEAGGWQVERALLSQLVVAPCMGCESCVTAGGCVIEDDDMPVLYEAFETCDAVIISAPTYWRNVPAQLKAVFDRTYGTGAARPLLGKPGGAMAVGRGSGGGQSKVLDVIHNYYLSCGMLCVPGELNGVTAVADKPGEIAAQPRRLAQARALGLNVLRCAEKLAGQPCAVL